MSTQKKKTELKYEENILKLHIIYNLILSTNLTIKTLD